MVLIVAKKRRIKRKLDKRKHSFFFEKIFVKKKIIITFVSKSFG